MPRLKIEPGHFKGHIGVPDKLDVKINTHSNVLFYLILEIIIAVETC
jgi:hypothetical protein